MSDGLHLVRVPVDARALHEFARRSKALGREDDEGYAVHALFAALFDHRAETADRVAPKPFYVGHTDRRVFDVLGYSRLSHDALLDRARQFADPLAWTTAPLVGASSKPMPTSFPKGTRLGFDVRVCPTRRVKKRGPLTRDKAEVDAFLARVWCEPDGGVLDREAVYRDWLSEQLGRDGAASFEAATMTSFKAGAFRRRTQGDDRKARSTSRPDVSFRGVLRVEDPGAFSALLARGLGRHRSFGFGMLLLRPPSPAP